MKFKNQWIIIMIISSLFVATAVSVEAADEIITDGTGDVISTDANGNIGIITYSPEIDVNGLDIKEATYTLQGNTIALTLQVKGSILDHGKFFDESQIDENFTYKWDFVSYQFILATSVEDYTIIYTNKTCNFTSNLITYDLPSSNFSVIGDTLTVTFPSTIAIEKYESLDVQSVFSKIDLSGYLGEGDFEGTFFMIADTAPNPELAGVNAESETKVGTVGETIKFNGTVDISTGQPRYIFNWTFGDGSSISDTQNPTHAYTKAGNYTYNLTVTDHTGVMESASGYINIIQKEGSGSGSSPPMLLFFAIILIIIVIAVIVIIWIIRR